MQSSQDVGQQVSTTVEDQSHAVGNSRRSLSEDLKGLNVAEKQAALSQPQSSLHRSPAWAIDATEITVGKRLGAGAYGEVFAGEWRRSRVAVKRLLRVRQGHSAGGDGGWDENFTGRTILRFISEMEILANVRHDHVVRFLGACVQPSNLCILFEYCPLTLWDLLRSRQGAPLPIRNASTIASHVAHGMYYLHACRPPILHLDLKSANILLDDFGRAKVCDFGLAHFKLDEPLLTSRVGAPAWTAPEVLRGESISEAADSYSYGVLLYELLSSQQPYANVPAERIIGGIITEMLARPSLPEGWERPPQLVELMHECWQDASERRPTFEVVLDVLESYERST
jgi:serine/threonine protein kinase